MLDPHTHSQYAYLEALGILCYVSRRDLPGAAASRRLAVASPPPPRAIEPESAEAVLRERVPGPGQSTRQPSSRSLSSRPLPPPSEPVPAGTPRQQPMVRFALATVVSGPCLWLEALPRGLLGREQVQLIHAMARALGVEEPPQVAQFDWPPHNNRQLDLGGEAARAALHSFLQRQLAERGCTHLLVLGEAAGDWLGAAPPEVACLVLPASTEQMLADATRKRPVWELLRPLCQRVAPGPVAR
ncbi:MAG: hypothetical protein ACK5HY_13260 [Parahaliea sp.]